MRYTSTSIFPCIMTMISNFTIFFSFKYLFSDFSLQIYEIFAFSYVSCCSFVNNFIIFFLKLIIVITYFLKDPQNFFIQSLHLYTSCLCSMSLNDDIVDNEKPEAISSPAFVVDEISGLFLHPSIFSIIHSRSG